MKVEVFEVERMRKEIDNYIEHIIICHEKNDFEMMKEESISLLFWGSQMIEVNNTIRQRDAILAITESLIHRIYEKPDMYVDFFDAKMYGELGKLAFSFREIKKRTGKLKDSSEFLNRLLLRNAYQKIIRFQPDKIMFDTYDILGGIAGVTYYLLDCPEILEKPDENQKVRELVCFLVYLSEDYIYQGKEILRYHIRRKQQWLKWERSHMKRGHINFGTAHGIIGPLVALSKARKLNILEENQNYAIEKLIGLYENFCVEENGILRYPRRLAIEDYIKGRKTDLTENSGWCYGNLSIIRALMKVAWYSGNTEKYQYYLDKFVAIIEQPIEAYRLNSPIVCHGYGSVVSLQIYAFLESGDGRCLANLERNLEVLLNEHQIKMVRDTEYKMDLSLLEGSAGTVLSMQNCITRNLTYGKLLLMD